MKLVKIKDIRVGQIWENKYSDVLLVKNANTLPDENIDVIQWNKDINLVNWLGKYKKDLIIKQRTSKEYIIKNACNWKLIGFLGITHEIKEDKLVKIPRAEFEVDDVVEFAPNKRIGIAIITKNIDGIRYDIIKTDNSEVYYNLCRVYLTEKRTKILGILSATHEFINERLVK